jgi:hypothetical protein
VERVQLRRRRCLPPCRSQPAFWGGGELGWRGKGGGVRFCRTHPSFLSFTLQPTPHPQNPQSPHTPSPKTSCGAKTYGDCCTGTASFWANNGYCEWPVDSLTLGSVTYSKAQLDAILDEYNAGTVGPRSLSAFSCRVFLAGWGWKWEQEAGAGKRGARGWVRGGGLSVWLDCAASLRPRPSLLLRAPHSPGAPPPPPPRALPDNRPTR